MQRMMKQMSFRRPRRGRSIVWAMDMFRETVDNLRAFMGSQVFKHSGPSCVPYRGVTINGTYSSAPPGAKKQSYRVVVADQRAPRGDRRIVENLGFYNPRTEPETFHIDVERAIFWLNQGAQPSEGVARLLKSAGAVAGAPAVQAQAA